MSRRTATLFAAWTLGAWAALAPTCGKAQEPASAPERAEAARLMNELMTGRGPIGGPFALTDQHGRRVGPEQWRGQVVLMYFGYTHCPDAWPTDLSNIATAIEVLGADGAKVQPVFVTLDPQRDRPELIGRYAESFNPRFAALGGTEAEVRAVALSYKVFFEKVPQRGTDQYLIDHNSFTDGYDGAVDIKRGSDFVTVSWNRVFGHDKNMLLGHSDDNGSQDIGHLRVSYHHNWFDGSTQRNPRVRFANPVHVYNNYYYNNSGYGVASTEGAGVLVEGNYFENVPDPYHLGEADSGPGTLVARNNHFVNSGSGQTGGLRSPSRRGWWTAAGLMVCPSLSMRRLVRIFIATSRAMTWALRCSVTGTPPRRFPT